MLASKFSKKCVDGKEKLTISFIIRQDNILPSKNPIYKKIMIPSDLIIGTDNKGSIVADKLINFAALPLNTQSKTTK